MADPGPSRDSGGGTPAQHHHPNQSSSTQAPSDPSRPSNNSPDPNRKPIIVGLYGVPASGKTYLLDQLKKDPRYDRFTFFEGSVVISGLVPGGLAAFKKLDEQEKARHREDAIEWIQNECRVNDKVGVVAGHYMFWQEGEREGSIVLTQKDLDTYTHILYLDVDPAVIVQRIQDDVQRQRVHSSVPHLRKWQQFEKSQLQAVCRQNNILFSRLTSDPTMLLERVSMLLPDFARHNEQYNINKAQTKLENILHADLAKLETVLFIDGDRTLGAEDTGKLFWEYHLMSSSESNPLPSLFGSPLLYSYTAFRQATLLCEDYVEDDQSFDDICSRVSPQVKIHPEFVSLLQRVAREEHVGAVVVTCGLCRIWEKVLSREGLSDTAKVIGGGRISDRFVVTPSVKSALVSRLRNEHNKYVWAFGDSPLDLEMMREADQAIVLVGEEDDRSKTMDIKLKNAIEQGSVRARQVLLPGHVSPRLDASFLPQVRLSDLLDSIFSRRSHQSRLIGHAHVNVRHATSKNAAKLIMTPTRDASVLGTMLRKAHQRLGWYLATEFVSDVLGVEQHAIAHVQGHETDGYRLQNEQLTTIVALMRGGEAMAFGVNDAFPLAMFVHAHKPEDVELDHLKDRHAVVLVDSVINTGRSIVGFVQRVRELHATIRIVIVAGVVHVEAVSECGAVRSILDDGTVTIVALRLSENKFRGQGETDTGNRLFNTTNLS